MELEKAQCDLSMENRKGGLSSGGGQRIQILRLY